MTAYVDKPTRYSTDERYRVLITNDAAINVFSYVIYVLWDSSTEFMVAHGLPSDTDVKQWIEWMKQRADADCQEIQDAIIACEEYINS